MQFSPGNKDYWQNGETTWDPRVSEKSINVFWLVFRHQLQKSLWRKLHYWFHISFLWWAFVITFDYSSNLLLSLCVCVIEWRGYIRFHFFCTHVSSCVFLPTVILWVCEISKNHQIYYSAYRDSTGGWTKLSIFWWRRETLIRWGITCHGNDSAGEDYDFDTLAWDSH